MAIKLPLSNGWSDSLSVCSRLCHFLILTPGKVLILLSVSDLFQFIRHARERGKIRHLMFAIRQSASATVVKGKICSIISTDSVIQDT